MRSWIDYTWYRVVHRLAVTFNSDRLHMYADDLYERGYERHVLGVD